MVVRIEDVKRLRDLTGAKISDCKGALEDAEGDIERARDVLRAKGVVSAVRKEGRETKSGAVGIFRDQGKAVLVELSAETDFVSMNSKFHELVYLIGDVAMKLDELSVESLLAASAGNEGSVSDAIKFAVSVMGENLLLRRTGRVDFDRESEVIGSYIHNKYADGIGKMVYVVVLGCDGDISAPNMEMVGRVADDIAMHAAAMRPLCVSRDLVDPELSGREESMLRERFEKSGKPDEILKKMISGSMDKFYREVVLLEQPYIVDSSVSVGELLNKLSSDIGCTVRIVRYLGYCVG